MFADSSTGSAERRSYVPAGNTTSSPGSAASRAARMAAASSCRVRIQILSPKSVTSKVLPVAGPGVGTSIGAPDRSTKPGTCQLLCPDGAGPTASSLTTGPSDSSTVHAEAEKHQAEDHPPAIHRLLATSFRTNSFIILLLSFHDSFRPSRRPHRGVEKYSEPAGSANHAEARGLTTSENVLKTPTRSPMSSHGKGLPNGSSPCPYSRPS